MRVGKAGRVARRGKRRGGRDHRTVGTAERQQGQRVEPRCPVGSRRQREELDDGPVQEGDPPAGPIDRDSSGAAQIEAEVVERQLARCGAPPQLARGEAAGFAQHEDPLGFW